MANNIRRQSLWHGMAQRMYDEGTPKAQIEAVIWGVLTTRDDSYRPPALKPIVQQIIRQDNEEMMEMYGKPSNKWTS